MTARYAIYFAPDAGSALERFGAAWLGCDAATGERLSRPRVEGFGDALLEQVTATPRGYGFHATLAPPMRLAEGCTRAMLDEALAAFAARRTPFRAPPLELAAMDDFLALVLSRGSEAMQALENDVIDTFHRFRAPPAPAEYIRRQLAPLTPRQEALLRQWGYPYVLDEFHFHDAIERAGRARAGGAAGRARGAALRRTTGGGRDRPVRAAGARRALPAHAPLPLRRLTLSGPGGPSRKFVSNWMMRALSDLTELCRHGRTCSGHPRVVRTVGKRKELYT